MKRLIRALPIVAMAGLLALIPAALRADPKYLPSDTSAVIIINVKQMMASELAKGQKDGLDKLKEIIEAQGGPEAAAVLKHLKDAGFDPFKDLHAIIAGGPNPKDPDAGFLIVRGNFDQEKIHTVATQAARDNADALKVIKVGATNVYQISPPGGNMLYAAVVNKDTLIASGNKEGLTDGIARVTGAKKATHSKELKELLRNIGEKQSIAFVATGDALGDIKNNPAVPFADSVQGLSGFITLDKGVNLQVGVLTKDAQSAQQLTAVVTGLVELGKNAIAQKGKDDPRFEAAVDVIKTLKLKSEGAQMILRAEITPETIEKLKKLAPGN